MSYDTVLLTIGEFGPYQKRIYFILCALAIPIAHHSCSVIFNTIQPSFRCAVPGLSNDTYYIGNEEHRRQVNASIPYDPDSRQFSQCKMYENDFGEESINDSSRTVSCGSWVYERETAITTVVADFDLVCARKIYSNHLGMMMMLGNLIGSFIGGPLSDRFGRKKITVFLTLCQAIVGISFAFATSVYVVLALRLVLAIGGMILFMSIFVLLAEIVGPSKRTIATMGIMFGWVVGMMTLTLICYLVPDWRIAQIVMSVPGLLGILCWWYLPESPRWLLIRQRTKEAKAVIVTMAKVNKVALPNELDAMLTYSEPEEEKTNPPPEYKIWHLFTNRILLTRIAILSFSWCTISMVYYGLTLNVEDLVEGSIYMNFALQALMELLAYVIIIALMGKVGRKKIFCGSILLSGLACLATVGPVFADSEIAWLNSTLYCIGKFGITGAFAVIYIVTAELLPTVVRNSGLGLCSFFGRIAGIVAPYMVSLGALMGASFDRAFPLMVFGLCSIIAGLTALLLPETRNRKLPETIEDMKKFPRSDAKELNLQIST